MPRSVVAGVLLAAVGTALAPQAWSQTLEYTYLTFAGVGGEAGNTDGYGGAIGLPFFYRPTGVAVNAAGTIYVTDSGNAAIRAVTPAGVVTTLAGSLGSIGALDGTGSAASFNSPQGPAVDSAGNIYVAEFNNSLIRKITPAGVVTTFAGAVGLSGSLDGTGTAARFFRPSAVAIDSSGNLYVADSGNNTIRKITSAGVVTTLAGLAGTSGAIDGAGTVARFNYPRGVAVDSSGNVFVADTLNNAIRKVSPTGDVTTLAGKFGTFGSWDGTSTAARFNSPNSLAIDSAGNLYVADELNNSIRKVTKDGVVTTLAGRAGSAGDGTPSGAASPAGRIDSATASAARFSAPSGVAVDSAGNVYVADYSNELIRKISAAGVVSTLAGAGGIAGAQDGAGYILNPDLFYSPASTAVDGAGNVFVSDTANNAIRKITAAGVVTTFAGNPLANGWRDGLGGAAIFNSPGGIALDGAGNVYVADTANHAIRKVDSTGLVSTLAGIPGTAGSADGPGASAKFNLPSSVAVDAAGVVYVADYGNHTVRMIALDGTVTTVAGTAGTAGSANGLGTAGLFNHPRDVAVDGSGTLYVADSGNHTIRRITAGLVTTLAGAAGVTGSADGAGSVARFNSPAGLAVDSAGNVFVVDTNNSTIRKISLAGAVTTVGGAAGSVGNIDGLGSVARFDHPTDLSVDAAGNLYVADKRNHTIRKALAPGSGGGGGGGSGGGSGGGPGSGTGGTGGTGGVGSIGNSGATGSAAGTGVGTGFLLHPNGVGIASTNVVFVADTANHCIKQVATDGTVTVFAGTAGSSGTADGTGTAARFSSPTGLAIDSSLNLYVCDTGNGTIRKVTSAGVVTTIAGTAGTHGSTDGKGTAAQFSAPTGIALDVLGNLFVTDATNCTIRKIDSDSNVTTVAGTNRSVGDADGLGAVARFNNPTGMVIDTLTPANLYIADTFNNTIRKVNTADVTKSTTDSDGKTTTTVVTPAWTVTTLAGSPGISGAYDGIGAFALFNLPQGVGIDGSGNVFVADTGNNSIRRVSSKGSVSTFAGVAGISGARDGAFGTALFNQPQSLYVASIILVSDSGNSVLRTVNSQSIVNTVKLVAPTTTSTGSTGSTGSSSGGGSLEPWLAGALLALAAGARRGRRAA